MKGVIFAAGLGTRLYPFTKDRPKALVEVGGKTMLERTIDRLTNAGVKNLVVNVHAFSDKVINWINSYLENNRDFNIVVSDETNLLLETGGGLKKMKPLLEDEPFLVHNVDILSTFPLDALIAEDKRFSDETAKGRIHLATLAVRKTESDRYFLFNNEGLLCGWENVKTGEKKISRQDAGDLIRFGFTGVHIIHPVLFELMDEEGIFSITDVYIRLSAFCDIHLFDISQYDWFDIGTPDQLKVAESFV